jgi:DNA transposition AAA+ family ATPase
MTQPTQAPHPLPSNTQESDSSSYVPKRNVSWKPDFILTEQYVRFKNFCMTCCHYRTIGLCDGTIGVGKTMSARYYANWDFFEQQLPSSDIRHLSLPAAGALPPHVAFYTPPTGASAKRIDNELRTVLISLALIADSLIQNDVSAQTRPRAEYIDQIIIDEANRLDAQGCAVIRDLHARYHFSVIFVGIPGLRAHLRIDPQLHSLITFRHSFPNLEDADVRRVLHRKFLLGEFPLQYETQITDEAVGTIIDITHGNFRALNALLIHIDDVLYMNKLQVLDLDVIETARKNLLSGKKPWSDESGKRKKGSK